MRKTKNYDKEYKIQAVLLGREIGFAKAAAELGVPADTVYSWNKAAKAGRLDLGPGNQIPEVAQTQAERIQALEREVKALSKENKRLMEENEFLAEASAFFAASRRKSARD